MAATFLCREGGGWGGVCEGQAGVKQEGEGEAKSKQS